MMKANMGSLDKVLRVLAAAIVFLLWYQEIISGTTAIVLGSVAVIFFLTSLISFCPMYLPFGINTARKKLKSNVN